MITLGQLAGPSRLADDVESRPVHLARAVERHVVVRPAAGEAPAHMLERAADLATERGLVVLKQTIFGAAEECAGALAEAGEPEWPVTWADGSPCGGGTIAGTILHCVEGVRVDRVRLDGRVVGSTFEDGVARYAILAGIEPENALAPRPEQARSAFCRMEAALAAAGMQFTDVARTWLFIDRILEWYDDLNAMRTQFFRERDVFAHMVPASTGVGMANPRRNALVCEAIAITGADVRAVSSPLQCSARDYGSSFSRAVEITAGASRRLLISGTASIAPAGHTLHVGDCAAQISQTFDVVEALLRSRDMDFSNVTRSVVYFRHPADAPLFDAFLQTRGMPYFPAVVARADICRDDLLFEIELDAAAG